jgi:hypothetical protein
VGGSVCPGDERPFEPGHDIEEEITESADQHRSTIVAWMEREGAGIVLGHS